MSEHSSLRSQLTILLSQASAKPCPFFFQLGNEVFPYIVCMKYESIDGKVVAPEIQKSLTTHCCMAKVASQEVFSWPCLKGHLSALLSLANTHLSHARNKFDNANLISTWLPSPPHI